MTNEHHPAADGDRQALAQESDEAGARRPRAPAPAIEADLVDEVGMGSFPASDPPGWWGGS